MEPINKQGGSSTLVSPLNALSHLQMGELGMGKNGVPQLVGGQYFEKTNLSLCSPRSLILTYTQLTPVANYFRAVG